MSTLDSIGVKSMTVREVILKAFNDDWNNRKKVEYLSENDSITIQVNFSVDVSVENAKEVLKTLEK